ncbi:lipase, gastric [Monoraphidium neglectum]|uniref:Lipase, gastric n=1 Tax=Monoraphidium neglectum TaxID=145388 RepID=A0A0D2MNN7_9CHLO|nr:lipase, gastric [Monoraphidium neglectum]KIZ02122.1 lipase, gastric [Monoraphidium neglectum]|eukprot:XP_013901141.1 lipase, gastric [Monoraphidium neglectum]
MEDLVLPWGYPLETYPVETEDGFVLRLYRIPYGVKNSTKPDPRKPVVLLIHGITLASSCFVVLDPESSMGFYLADAGFDVWMLNTRSNTYSRGNRYRGDTSVAYWQYSIDELALLDLPAQIDFILKFTGKPSLATVGHSQGCTLPLMLLSAKPEYNAKVWLMMQIGAVTHAEEIQAKYMRHQAELRSAQKVLGGAAIGNFIMNSVTSQLISSCNGTYSRLRYCQKLIHFLVGGL